MISILILLGVAVMGVCLLAIALSDRRRPFTIAEVDVDVEPRQPARSNTPTSRLSGLDLPPAARRTFAALSSRTSSWRAAPPRL